MKNTFYFHLVMLSALLCSSAFSYTQNTKISHDNIPVYNRSEWPHWIDEDKDCQDTRAELLIEEGIKKIKFTTHRKCVVYSGEWLDPYTAKKFTLASNIDIDHIVPLHWAHEHGGAYWTKEKKKTFANDVDNLIIVDKAQNRAKGSKGLDKWLPTNVNYKCHYAEKWMEITEKYDLYFKPHEVIDIYPLLNSCNIH